MIKLDGGIPSLIKSISILLNLYLCSKELKKHHEQPDSTTSWSYPAVLNCKQNDVP